MIATLPLVVCSAFRYNNGSLEELLQLSYPLKE